MPETTPAAPAAPPGPRRCTRCLGARLVRINHAAMWPASLVLLYAGATRDQDGYPLMVCPRCDGTGERPGDGPDPRFGAEGVTP